MMGADFIPRGNGVAAAVTRAPEGAAPANELQQWADMDEAKAAGLIKIPGSSGRAGGSPRCKAHGLGHEVVRPWCGRLEEHADRAVVNLPTNGDSGQSFFLYE